MKLASDFHERQSSESWQNGVRWENRFREMELEIEELKRRVNWFYVCLGGMGLLIIGLFLKK